MTISNVTPATPYALPYTYTDNYGQAYQFASISQQGCVDTVYPLTANAGGTFNVKGVPLQATNAYQVLGDADHQFGPVFIACQSLVNQLPSGSTSSTTSVLNVWMDLFGTSLTGNWLIDDFALALVVILGLAFLGWVWNASEKHIRRR